MTNDELYDRVVREGRRRRHRTHRAVGAGVACLALLAAVPLVTGGGDDTLQVRSDEGSSTSVDASPTSPPTDVSTSVPDGDTPTTSTTSGHIGTTTTDPPDQPACRNSTDPACGPFRWDPTPAPNQPATLAVTISPARPRVGETVTIDVHASDPDAAFCEVVVSPLVTPDGYIVGQRWNDGCMWPAGGCLERAHGPWDTPPAVPTVVNPSFTHTFTESGSYVLEVEARSKSYPHPSRWAEWHCPLADQTTDPYASHATETITVTVDPAP